MQGTVRIDTSDQLTLRSIISELGEQILKEIDTLGRDKTSIVVGILNDYYDSKTEGAGDVDIYIRSDNGY